MMKNSEQPKCRIVGHRGPLVYCTDYAFGIINACMSDGVKLKFCPICGVDIRGDEPEPSQPIIKKSGEIWVARYEGIDYLCFDSKWELNDHKNILTTYPEQLYDNNEWKPFSEIEITDEIAKLRPMVKCKEFLLKLYGVANLMEYNFIAIKKDCTPERWDNVRLATIEDLP